MFHRGWYGWAPIDTWGYDHYLASSIAPALRHLAKYKHGVPGVFMSDMGFDDDKVDEAADAWTKWLNEKADWFDWYTINNNQYSDEYRIKYTEFTEKVLPNFVKYWGCLWD